MSDRITEKMLNNLVAQLNDLTLTDRAPYCRNPSGKLVANIGTYYLDMQYGGVNLSQMVSVGGGITCPLGQGMRSKRELYGELKAMIAGLTLAGELL